LVTPRILIVTGRAAVSSELRARLAALGYGEAAIASSGDEAAASAASAAPELVLMDTLLPGETNAAAAAAALRRHGAVQVLFIGSEADEAVPRDAGPAEPHGLLALPIGDGELRLTIELALCRHRAARAVQEFEGFFAVSIDMFCFLGFDGYFRRLNPAWERTLGFSREELMSRPFIEFVHPDDRERTLAQNARVRAGGQATGFENRYRCSDGSYRWFHWNAAPHVAGGVIYSSARDITARKEAEAERDRLVGRLEASLAEVRTLREILPICMYCKKIRDDENYWQTVESYISRHTATRFSHGICPSCLKTEVEPQLARLEELKKLEEE